MNKTPTVFLRDTKDMNYLTATPNPLAQWVLDGEGVATRKYDGTCVMLDSVVGEWWARREVKKGRTPPPGWRPVEVDDVTGKSMGWEIIGLSGFSKFFEEALVADEKNAGDFTPGTYELCGPKINGNPEKLTVHKLFKHSEAQRLEQTLYTPPFNYDDIKHLVQAVNLEYGWEGLVWHHPDGRMAKMKARDYRRESGRLLLSPQSPIAPLI